MRVLSCVVLVATACRTSDDDPAPTDAPAPPLFDGEPVLRATGETPLSRELVVATEVPTRLRVRMVAPGFDQVVRWPELAASHDVPLLGAPPDALVTVEVTVTDEEGTSQMQRLAFENLPLAEPWVSIDVLSPAPERVTSGYVLLPLETPDGLFWLAAVDLADGRVGWIYRGEVNFGDVRMTPDGTLFGLSTGVWEITTLGQRVRRFATDGATATDDDVVLPWTNLHHEVYPLGNGTYASLTHRRIVMPMARLSYEDPSLVGSAETTDDGVVLFDDAGHWLGEWWMTDLLDPLHIGFDALNGEWTHANAVIADADGLGLIAEARHQDTLFDLGPDGQLRWILSRPTGWRSPWSEKVLTPIGDVAYPLHPHGPSLAPDGTLLAFDNGNDGATPYDTGVAPRPRSRVLAWTIDPEAMTVRQAWTWTPPGDVLFSGALGNATALPDGHVVACFGFLDGEGDVTNEEAGRGHKSVRVMEFVPGETQPVGDLRIWLPIDVVFDGTKAYRAVPTATLYPADVEVVRDR